ncbi:MAG: hypothetical protein WHX52_21850 [Anaerolineae bacterium]
MPVRTEGVSIPRRSLQIVVNTSASLGAADVLGGLWVIAAATRCPRYLFGRQWWWPMPSFLTR